MTFHPDYDDVPAQIDRLHEEAEDLAETARHTPDPRCARELREDARRKIREAARLRAQLGEDA